MTIKNQYRDVTLQEIRESDIGRTLRVAGWIENIRDHGGVSFVDLRDMYGVLQVVMRDTSLLDGLSKEMSVSIEGLIEKRDEETYNPRIPTGTIEMEAHKVDVLGRVYKQLPFEIMTSKETREDVRLKYRYLDLRRAPVRRNLELRHRMTMEVRRYLDSKGFLEIETPMLVGSTPEGARDFVVPSRMNPGQFYALPQSPQ
ncbi:MAG: Asp-tRNA(Asn)/Glu-tRNA(Gln) amidotransferase GatCAB subunit C, partial [Lachnospiraceae bacterium]|nr:Asp-tRNA(Asn)/Glu-tRNA(Gln) amidotransferase GatCAB subunit C [Lachnospiraceae bacterium]